MSKPLSEQEKQRRQLHREEKKLEKEMNPVLDERCYEILRVLREADLHPDTKFNSKYFEKLFDTSNITILRAIKKLKDMDLIEDTQVNGSYVIKKNVTEYYSNETKKNIALVASVKGLLDQYEKTPIFESVKKLCTFLEPNLAKKDKLIESPRIVVPPQIEYTVNISNWDKIFEAMQINHKIRFRYTKPYTDSENLRTVWPYQLVIDDGTIYLFAHSEYHNVDILYDINFMTNITITGETFTLPQNYDFRTRCGGGRLGAFKNDHPEKFKIKFTDYAKLWIKNHKWADDQEFTEDEDSTIITFTSSQYDKILHFILQWGTQAEPLAPERLVKEWKSTIMAMYEKIKE